MSTITAIEQLKRLKSRYALFVDDHFFASLDEEILVRNHLKVGMEINEDQLKEIIYENDMKAAFDKSLSYLAYRPRSRQEITNYLEKKGYQTEVIEKILLKLANYHFVDDEDFARRWVKDRNQGKMVGKRVIKQELRQKGIAEGIVADALEDITEEDELKKAIRFARKILPRYESQDPRQKANKISQALGRRGFGWDIIYRAVRQALGSDAEIEYDD